MVDVADFVDRLYEASVIPEYWPKVLQEFSTLAGAKGAVLLVLNEFGMKSTSSSEHFQQMVDGHYQYAGAHERTRRLLALQHAGFATDLDVFSEEEMLAESLFSEFAIPRGYGMGTATVIQTPSGDSIVFHAEKSFHDGKFQQSTIDLLDSFRPHLARSSLLAARLGLEHARSISQALGAVGLPAAVLNLKGHLLAANDLLTALIPSHIQDRTERIKLANTSADALLKTAIENILHPFPNAPVSSIPVAANETMGPIIFHLLPIKGAAQDVFARSNILLIASPVAPKIVANANVLQALFDLTPSEARVAYQLGNGHDLDEISKILGKTTATVRNQIASVLTKSGLHRRIDLVAMLQGSVIGDLK